MGRPVYPHELEDPDFSWLLNSFRENNPECTVVESSCLPIVIIRGVHAPEEVTETGLITLPAEIADDDIRTDAPARSAK